MEAGPIPGQPWAIRSHLLNNPETVHLVPLHAAYETEMCKAISAACQDDTEGAFSLFSRGLLTGGEYCADDFPPA